MSTVVVDGAAVRARLLRCVQLLGSTAVQAIEQCGSVGNEALLERIQSGLVEAELGIPNATLLTDQALSGQLAAIAMCKGFLGGMDEEAPELEPYEKHAGRLPRSLKVNEQDLRQKANIAIRFLQELDYEKLALYLNFFDAYYDGACEATARAMAAKNDSSIPK
jgi:hypothetical protein